MPRIRCFYVDCVFLDDDFCGATAVEIDPDEGCMTYTQSSVLLDEEIVEEEWEDLGFDEAEDDDLWLDDDDDF